MQLRKIYITTALALFSFFCGFLYQVINDDQKKKSDYAKQVNEYLHSQEAEIQRFREDIPFIRRQILQLRGKEKDQDLEKLKSFEKKDFTILIFKPDTDSLVFWTNNKVIITRENLKDHPSVEFTKINNGYYEVIQDQVAIDEKQYALAALIPLKYSYTLSSDYLLDHFTANKGGLIPPSLQLTQEPTDFVIKSKLSDNQFYLSGENNLSAWHHQRTLFSIYGLAALFLLIAIYFSAKIIMIKWNPTLGALFLIFAIFLLRFVTIYFDASSMFSALSLFSRQINAPLNSPTIGDFLINVVILLSIIYFFYREFHVRSFNHLPYTSKIAVVVANFFSVILSLFLVISVIKYLILNSEISYNFNNIFNLNIESKAAIFGIILLITALFLFNQRMMHTITNVKIGKHQRMLCLAGAIILSIPLIYQLDFMMPIFEIILVTIIYVVLFDLFTDYKRINLTWLVLWLVIYSGLTSSFLFKYNNDKDILLRYDYAVKLAEKRDTIAEEQISHFVESLRKYKYFRSLAGNKLWTKSQEEIAQNQIDKHFSDHSYLFNNYNYEEQWDRNIPVEDALANQMIYRYEEAENTSFNNIRLAYQENKLEYLAEVNIPVIRDNQNENQKLYFRFREKQRDKSKVYTELLLNDEYKNLKYLSHYDFSIYNNRKLVRDGKNIPLDRLIVPERGSYEMRSYDVKKYGSRSEFVYHSPDNVIVVLGKEREGRIKLISLFCFIFAILIGFAILVALINTFIKFLPSNFTFSIYRKPSLRNRIQLSVIALIVASFFVIGFVTVLYFRNEKVEYHDGRLSRKAGTIKDSAEGLVDNLMERKQGSMNEYAKLVKEISDHNRMDINMFDLSGRLVSSSEADIYNKGIVGEYMNPVALHELKVNQEDEYTQDEEMIGNLAYKAMYLPINGPSGKAEFYFGLPYYTKQDNLRQDVDGFMGMLLNVYVFLLLIAGSSAILIANSITKPISKIGEKLKQFKLGGANEPLEWNSKDELGALIEEYNRMIQKLKDSASLLAKSEREGAWREMAKQVAHEIKNPLTPMKLSIQYLQRAHKSGADPKSLDDLIGRVTHTLIEQIDNLAAIATEFSTFAKMPQAQNEQINLNALVSSVYDLFRERGGDTEVSIRLINKEIDVIADKNQLLRVLNNLIKNAIQAIPEDRTGVISISLEKEDNKAVIVVTDNGTGISEEKRDKVFVPNFTTKSSGTGLGLAMSKNIVESFYGSIYFETKVNEGTSFFVKLPIEEIKEPQRNAELVI